MEKHPCPLPLHPTPWYFRILGWGKWRYKRIWHGKLSWRYLSRSEYRELFGHDAG